ncbi:hypothetical protein AB4277_03670 [Vibrio splendidus]
MELSTIVAFSASAISGVAGVFLQRYLSRAKPTINVTSLSFEGDVVEVSEEVQSLSRKCNWSSNIHRYIAYEDLKDFEVYIAQSTAALQQEKENVDKWLEHFISDGVGNNFSVGQMVRSPALADLKVFGVYFSNSIKRRDFPDLPTSLEELEGQKEIFPIEISSKAFSVHCGNFAMPFKKDEFAEDTHEQVKHLIYSISRGDVANIIKIHEAFSSYAGSQVYDYQKLIGEVRKHLINNSKLSLKVSISNTGHTPIILKPYFAAKLEFGEKNKSMILENVNKNGGKLKAPFVDIVRSAQYQKSSKSTNYVSVEPGKSVQVNLVSSEGLAEDSHEIAEFYELGGLKGRVFANSENGSVIKSKLTLFSKTISETEKKELLRTAS